MVVLIFMKWSINWEHRMYTATCFDVGFTPQNVPCTSSNTTEELCPLDYGGSGDGCQPPNLITTLINIALAPGTCDEPMFKGQAAVQVIAWFSFPTPPLLSFLSGVAGGYIIRYSPTIVPLLRYIVGLDCEYRVHLLQRCSKTSLSLISHVCNISTASPPSPSTIHATQQSTIPFRSVSFPSLCPIQLDLPL